MSASELFEGMKDVYCRYFRFTLGVMAEWQMVQHPDLLSKLGHTAVPLLPSQTISPFHRAVKFKVEKPPNTYKNRQI